MARGEHVGKERELREEACNRRETGEASKANRSAERHERMLAACTLQVFEIFLAVTLARKVGNSRKGTRTRNGVGHQEVEHCTELHRTVLQVARNQEAEHNETRVHHGREREDTANGLLGKAAERTDKNREHGDNHHQIENRLGLPCGSNLFGEVPGTGDTGAGNEHAEPHGTESGERPHLHDGSHEARDRDRSTRIDVSHPVVHRSGARLEQEPENSEQNANRIDGFTALQNQRTEVSRAGRTVNKRHTVEEYGTEDGTRNEVLEHAFARIRILAADTHQGVHREAREFHGNKQGDKINRLSHEECAGRSEQHEPVGLATLVAFVTEGPLQARNAEQRAKQHGKPEQATDRVHGEQVVARIGCHERERRHAQSHEYGSKPGDNLVLVVVLKERFHHQGSEGTESDNDYREKVDDTSHWKPPSRSPERHLSRGERPFRHH